MVFQDFYRFCTLCTAALQMPIIQISNLMEAQCSQLVYKNFGKLILFKSLLKWMLSFYQFFRQKGLSESVTLHQTGLPLILEDLRFFTLIDFHLQKRTSVVNFSYEAYLRPIMLHKMSLRRLGINAINVHMLYIGTCLKFKKFSQI